MVLHGLVTLLAGDDHARSREEELAAARRDLEDALDALRNARGAWASAETIDVEAVRRALDVAERQLDAARLRLKRALDRER